eukprot:jgi/Chrpa1/2955/Chrysochromulina_OHIO_Genome00002282-RA
MAGIALRNSFLLTSPSPLASHSRKRSSTLPAFWRSAAAICCWIGGASGPSSRSILPSVMRSVIAATGSELCSATSPATQRALVGPYWPFRAPPVAPTRVTTRGGRMRGARERTSVPV